MIFSGATERVLAVVSDALYYRPVIEGFAQIGAVATSDRHASGLEVLRPFDEGRTGFVMGEAAAAALFEGFSPGTPHVAVVESYSAQSCPSDPVSPDPDGGHLGPPIREVRTVLEERGFELHHLIAHATATRANDLAESNAVVAAGLACPVVGMKGLLGHTMASSGLVELLLGVRFVREGVVPNTLGLERLDPAIHCNVATESYACSSGSGLIKVAAAIGGQASAIAMTVPPRL